MGPILGAEFLVAASDLRAFESAGQLAAYAGLIPAARDSLANAPVTIAGCAGATRSSSASSTSRRSLACVARHSPEPSTPAPRRQSPVRKEQQQERDSQYRCRSGAYPSRERRSGHLLRATVQGVSRVRVA
jgi:hypothetical protein